MDRPRRPQTRLLLLAGVTALGVSGVAVPVASAKELPDYQPAVIEVTPAGIDLPLPDVTDTEYDQERGRLFIAGTDHDTPSPDDLTPVVYDDRTRTLAPLVGADGVTGFVLDEPGERLVGTDPADDEIVVVSLETLEVTARYEAPTCSAATVAGSLLLCYDYSAVDLRTGEVIQDVPLIEPDGDRAWSSSPHGMVTNPDRDDIVYIASNEENEYLYRARVENDAEGSPFLQQLDKRLVPAWITDLEVSPEGGSVFVAGHTMRVHELSARDLSTTRVLETFNHFADVAISPEGRVAAGSSFDLAPQLLLFGAGRTQTTQAWWINPEDVDYTSPGTDSLETQGLQMARNKIFAVTVEHDPDNPELRVIPTRRPTVVTLRASRDLVLSGSRVRLTARISPPQVGRELSLRAPGYPRHVFETDRQGRVTARVTVKGGGNTFTATVAHTDRREGSRAVTTVDTFRIPD